QETYEIYRRGGNYNTVIENVRRINKCKRKYRSDLPALLWQFVAFGHNEHEIPKARKLAKKLGMSFHVKLNWENVFQPDQPVFSPVVDGRHVRSGSGLGVASRGEYLAKTGRMYVQEIICEQMWTRPQIDWDGKVLGCCVNFWGDYGNAFENGLLTELNNEKFN